MLRTTGMKVLNVGMIALFAAGCGVQAKTYVMDKERVNIEYEGGNAGYVVGKPKYAEPDKKTRRVYVLEFTKAVSESDAKKVKEETVTEVRSNTDQAAVEPESYSSSQGPLVIARPDGQSPAGNDEESYSTYADEAMASAPAESLTYTVVKDDTLQKISKKFYDSYGKWIKIYEANKDKIKNPNFVKPGTVLTIPPADTKK